MNDYNETAKRDDKFKEDRELFKLALLESLEDKVNKLLVEAGESAISDLSREDFIMPYVRRK